MSVNVKRFYSGNVYKKYMITQWISFKESETIYLGRGKTCKYSFNQGFLLFPTEREDFLEEETNNNVDKPGKDSDTLYLSPEFIMFF